VLAVDRFGNLITNIRRADLAAAAFRRRSLSIRIGGHVVPMRQSYGSGRAGEPLALVNSSGVLEIAVRDGSAAVMLALGRGTPVVVEAV
jgi:hypothetical protein